MTYGAIGASGVVNRFERFEAPYSSMVHDFSASSLPPCQMMLVLAMPAHRRADLLRL
jgi:carotenoid cleavage dioxygenase-like enzyme